MHKKFKHIVYIGIPSRTKGYWSTYTSLMAACTYAAKFDIGCEVAPHVGSSLICRARQNITWEFLFTSPLSTHFLQLDDDVEMPHDAIVKLIEADKNIVGGMYSLKSQKGKIAIRLKDAKKRKEGINIKDYPNQLMEVSYISGGCIMQKRELVERAWKHYYKDLVYQAGEPHYLDKYRDQKDVMKKLERVALYMPYIYQHENADKEYLSEDWAYCQRLIDMGEKIWLHTGVACVHWGLAPYGIDTGEANDARTR